MNQCPLVDSCGKCFPSYDSLHHHWMKVHKMHGSLSEALRAMESTEEAKEAKCSACVEELTTSASDPDASPMGPWTIGGEEMYGENM